MKPLIVCITLISCLSAGCAQKKPSSSEDICADNLKRVEGKLTTYSGSLDNDTRTMIENLIRAAKVQQEHRHYPDCLDKTERALMLLESNSADNPATKN